VTESPIVEVLTAIDRLDVTAVLALCSPDCHFATVDGRHADGHDAVQRLLGEFLSTIRATHHEVTAQWHQDDAWFAEVVATYELQDRTRIDERLRAFLLRTGPDGIRDVRVYGAHERPLTDRSGGYEPARLGGRLILPL
jgi:hypothetical protein